MSSYFVKSKNATLAQIAAAGNLGFIRWAAANMSVPAARDEAARLLASAPPVVIPHKSAEYEYEYDELPEGYFNPECRCATCTANRRAHDAATQAYYAAKIAECSTPEYQAAEAARMEAHQAEDAARQAQMDAEWAAEQAAQTARGFRHVGPRFGGCWVAIQA
jgi:hypothetical protein